MPLSTPQGPWWGEEPGPDACRRTHPLLLNRRRRSVRCPGFLGARVQGGSTGMSSSAGVGDCLLLDFSKGFFAVADGSDRNPSASREFIGMFAKMLADNKALSADGVYLDSEITALKDQFISDAEQLLVTFSFRDSCTFTGILLLRTTESISAVILHTGDSLLISCNLRTRDAFQFTKNNFWMVGRSQHYFQTGELPVNPDTRLLLATDGIGEIPIPAGMNRENHLLGLFATERIEEIPDHLLDSGESAGSTRDDIAIIAMDPFSMPVQSESFILGGTSDLEERAFQNNVSETVK